MRRAPHLAGAEVIGRRQLMPGVFNPDMAHKTADGFQPRIAGIFGIRKTLNQVLQCGQRFFCLSLIAVHIADLLVKRNGLQIVSVRHVLVAGMQLHEARGCVDGFLVTVALIITVG